MPRSNRTPSSARARLRRAALCLVLVLCGGSAALAQPTLVSVNTAGTNSGNGESLNSDRSLSHDGRFLVFFSDSSDLVANDTNGVTDVFVRDLATGTTRLVSVNAAGTGSGNARSGVVGPGPGVGSFSVSGNGRYVAFTSAASDLVAGDANGVEDVFVRDLQTNTTVLASVTAAGSGSGNGASMAPFLTPDGGSVTFRSAASNLVSNDTNGAVLDVFVRRLTTNTTLLVSVNAAGTGAGNMDSSGVSTSDDGRFVTFSSRSNNLVANDTNGDAFLDVFVRDLQAGTTTLVSATPGNTGSGNHDSSGSLISANGARVVFTSRATNLTALPDTNTRLDVFVRDLPTGTTTLVSVNRQGTAAATGTSTFLGFPAISNDGNVVAFSSNANDLTQDDAATQPDVFVRDLAAGSTELISVSAFGGMSGNGLSGLNAIGMSGDGRFIVYDSLASDLVGNDGDQPNSVGSADVFVRDRLTSRTLLASVATSHLSGHGDSQLPAVSRNGAVVTFSSRAVDLDPRDTDTQSDVFAVALAASEVEFTAGAFQVSEGVGAATVTVRRTGDTSTEAFVNYETSDGNATARKDYTAAFGRLRFAPGEETKTFQVIITDDRFNDDNGVFGEGIRVMLTDPVGTTLGAQETTFVVITDNDAADGPSPVKDGSFDTEFFVRQHYADFLGRVPDAGGLAFWVAGIESCGSDQQCREVKKIDTSAAFFLSIEFQETGFLAYRTHKAAFGDLPGKPVPVLLQDFLFDSRLIGENVVVGTPGWPEQLEANKQAYFNEFVTRTAFTALYPQTMTAGQFVDALFARAEVLPTQAERDAAVAAFGAGGNTGRAAALRSVAESQTLKQAETNRAFVLMQYFGYLRRNPDEPDFQNNPDPQFLGFNFWLQKLEQFNGNYVNAEMVKAFIQSIEYGDRFGL